MGFAGRALVLRFIASSAACGPAPRKPALSKAVPVPVPQKVAAPAPPSAPSELERLLLEAKISGGADGIVARDVKSGARGSLNLLEGGGWFSIAQTEDFSAVDGVPEAIDHVVNETHPSHPGSVWAGLRHTGSFGQLLRGLPLPSLADFPSE